MKKRVIALAIAMLPVLFVGCKKDEPQKPEEKVEEPEKPQPEKTVTEKEVMVNYAKIVHQNYVDALNDAKKLQTALKAFTDNPSEATQDAAKEAWLVSRESYGPSEAYRFAEGPIDGAAFDGGPEGLLNSWPLDENYIDYVQDQVDSGIINNVTEYPEITKELLVSLNQAGSEENVSLGYHAIEFLLWGQDLTKPSANKAGLRSYTDYTPSSPNYERRAKYLNIAAELVVEHLNGLVEQWKEGGSYRTEFLAMDAKVALTHVLTGIATLSSDELAGERMNVALKNQSQEDEHSCFSDNTHRDIRLNFDGIWNVYYGVYKYGNTDIKGASFANLVKQKDSKMAKEVNDLFKETKKKVEATGIPFDIAISSGQDSAEGVKVKAAVISLMSLGEKLVAAGKAIGLDPTNEPGE